MIKCIKCGSVPSWYWDCDCGKCEVYMDEQGNCWYTATGRPCGVNTAERDADLAREHALLAAEMKEDAESRAAYAAGRMRAPYPITEGPRRCTCPTLALMQGGCKCGGE